MKKIVLITGVLGGIGIELAKEFREKGYSVIGLDIKDENPHYCSKFIKFDINRFCADKNYNIEMKEILDKEIPELHVLINNAAVQILSSVSEIELDDWNNTINVNVTGPMLLSQFFLTKLERNIGSIINISSIHQQLTKRRFIAYATSKSALIGLTKAMSVDLCGRVRINSISPAAIDTQMLREGFNNDNDMVQALNKLHPLQRIGKPREVSKLALLLASDGMDFINGANIKIDGGISNVLKDLE
jgi:gluconate 5-dehydrogenase